MHRIDTGDVQLSTLALGAADAPPLLMLHGLVSGNLASWYSAFALPLAARHRVLLYDLRGHGDSSTPAHGYTLEHHADDLHAVLNHHRVDLPVTLIGHSLGALIALRYALRQPARVAQLLLVDAPMPAAEYVAPSLRGVRTRAALETYVDAELGQRMDLHGRRRERLQQRLAKLFFQTTLVADVCAMPVEDDAALRALNIPVTLIYGRHSPCVDAGRRLAQTLPHARLALLDGGHYLPEEAPAALLQILRDALDESPAPTSPATVLSDAIVCR